MEKKILIRFTIKSDLEQLPWLYRQYHNGDTQIQTNYDGMLDAFDKLFDNNDYKFVSAVDVDKLIGFCSVVVNHDIVEQQKPILVVWNLRVHPQYRKQNIGKSIMNFIETFGKSINADFIFLGCDKDNQNARNFYNKIGYSEDYGFYKFLK